MSEPDDIFGFQEADDGLDIDAIFGSNVEAPSDPPPIPPEPQSSKTIDAPTQAAGTPDAGPAAVPAEMKKESAAVIEAAAKTKPAAVTKTPTKEGTEPDLFAAFAETADETKPAPETGAVKAVPVAEQQTSLFDKPAIFKYGSAKDPITDASMTFEELRIQKAEDFPELEEGKKVSWTVKYGDVTKSIPLPKETTIAKIKEEIEKSKAFLDSLKKGKIKDPECLVTPKVVAGSKGVAAYKGVYPTVEAARRSEKVISLIPSSDGKIYEMRTTELGEFIAPKNKITDFSEVRAGFTPALPLIPRELMGQLSS